MLALLIPLLWSIDGDAVLDIEELDSSMSPAFNSPVGLLEGPLSTLRFIDILHVDSRAMQFSVG